MSDSSETAKFIHELWPFIPEDEAREFCGKLFGVRIELATIKIVLWVTKRVLEHKLTK